MAGISTISLNSKAEIYEAILSGTSDYSDATIELGLQNDSSFALDYFDFGLSSGEIDHLIFTYRGESTDFTNEETMSMFSRVIISSGNGAGCSRPFPTF